MSRMDFSINLSPLNTTVSRKVISFSDISAVNFIVGWNVLGRRRHRCNVSILLAWYCFVGLNLFQSPP